MELSKKQKQWVKNIQTAFKGLQLCSGDEDLGFSWSGCDCCSSDLGGDRFKAVALNNKTMEHYDLEVCVDCVQYIANGDVPEDEYID